MSHRGRANIQYCSTTGKQMLTARAAFDQAERTECRKVVARHCPHCGRWHVNSPAAFTRRQRMLERLQLQELRARLDRQEQITDLEAER